MSALGIVTGLPSGLAPSEADIHSFSVPGSSVLNAVVSFKVPGDYWYRVQSYSLTCNASAAAATRIPALQILDEGGNVRAEVPAVAGHTAGGGGLYTFLPGLSAPFGAANGAQAIPFPDILLPSSWSVAIFVQSAQAGDIIGTIFVTVLRTPTGASADTTAVPLETPALV